MTNRFISAIKVTCVAIPLALLCLSSAHGQSITGPANLTFLNGKKFGTTVNTVLFTGKSSSTTWGSITFGGYNSSNATAFGSGTGAPWNTLSVNYANMLKGGSYASTGAAVTSTLNGLTVGHDYLVQFWVNDNRSGATATRTETVTSSGGSAVTLAYNNTQAAGGVGQYSIGTFTATAMTLAFTNTGNASSHINAIQVRDTTPPSDLFLAWIDATWPTLADKTLAGDSDNDGIANRGRGFASRAQRQRDHPADQGHAACGQWSQQPVRAFESNAALSQ